MINNPRDKPQGEVLAARTVYDGGLSWSGAGPKPQIFQLLPHTPVVSVPRGGWLDGGADGEGLGEDAPDPWGGEGGWT